MVTDDANTNKNNKDGKKLSKKEKAWLDSFPVLSEKDFYPPNDNRILHSGIGNIRVGDSFDRYMVEYNELCNEEEIYDENYDEE